MDNVPKRNGEAVIVIDAVNRRVDARFAGDGRIDVRSNVEEIEFLAVKYCL